MPNYELAFVDNNGIPLTDGILATAYINDGTNTILETSVIGQSPATANQGAAFFATLIPNVIYKFGLSGIAGFRILALPVAPQIVIPLGISGDIGPEGPTGPQGQGLRWGGTWNSVSIFNAYDIVFYQGSAYIAVAQNLNAVPGVSPDWQLIASQGMMGTAGTNGSTGATGPTGISFTFRGAWSSGITYALNDVVYYNGSTYISIASPNTNNNPASVTTDWSLMAVGAGSTVTTGPISSTGSGATISIPVANGIAFPNLSYIVLSDGINIIYAQITSGGGTTTLTATVQYPITATSILSNATATFGGPLVNSFNFYDISGQFNGLVTPNVIMQRIVAGRAYKLQAGVQTGHAICGTAPTGNITFTIARNGTSIGTVTFASGGTIGNVTISSATSFSNADVLTVSTQPAADATLADVAYTIAGIVI